MYLLLLAFLLGAKRESSTCENVRSAATPYRPVTQPAHGRPVWDPEAVSTPKCQHGYGRHSTARPRLLSPADGRLGPMVELRYSYGTASGTSLYFVSRRIHHQTEMTSLFKNLAVLLLFLIATPLLHSHLFTHAASASPPITHPRIIFMPDFGSDEDDADDDHSPPPIVPFSARVPLTRELCQYDPCSEKQEPCEHLSSRTGCLCPGLSGADMPPHAPRIQALLPVNEGDNRGKVEVQWCAPSSVVSGYIVVVEGSNRYTLEFGDALRQGLVGSLEVGTKVCVEAKNKAGHSTPSDFSCMRCDPMEA
ncbi:LRRN4 C-terminal-like protein [Lates japonicus]|uniref:LRRN4 C-terminal-like protein n=1 Tax=Lates japonicus TaxID=270547 RepID=A0AAD3ND65_LATJO|nr:LRRN4 C-terminal-like protein [Lates japonicus]